MTEAAPGNRMRAWLHRWTTLREAPPTWEAVLLAVLCIVGVGTAWWVVTRGEPESRWISPLALPSPAETFGKFREVWGSFETPDDARRTMLLNTLVTLRRVCIGFGLALLVGVPVGIAAGCFPRWGAFLSPLVMFGRNIPLAAVLPLMIFIFGIGEQNKVMFIFVASVAFVISDSARAIADVSSRYVDTAYTLGAGRWQTIIKVLVPLALPTIFSSARVMFGLAFGYIMLAESMRGSDDVGGLGNQIQIFQRRGSRENIYLILILIPLVALFVDRVLFWTQRELFPHVYGGDGYLHRLSRFLIHRWDDLKHTLFGSTPLPGASPSGQLPVAARAPVMDRERPMSPAPAQSSPNHSDPT
ncbi:MAG: ABC transporter permease [Pirellulaceae bacterium]